MIKETEIESLLIFLQKHNLNELELFKHNTPQMKIVMQNFYKLCQAILPIDSSSYDLIIELVKQFHYIHHLSDLLEEKLLENPNTKNFFTNNDHPILLLANEDQNSSSSALTLMNILVQKLYGLYSIPYRNREHTIAILNQKALEKISKEEKIILIDDFIGTGNKIIKAQKKIKEAAPHITIKIFAVCIMDEGFNSIISNGILQEDVQYLFLKNKVISDSTNMNESEKKLKKKKLQSITNVFCINKKLTGLGYKNSEALFKINSHNTPNNIIDIFHEDFIPEHDFCSIFPRIKKNKG
ncbi:hypothetical protein RHO13_05785 [Orbus wheelerorum]|uniref:phosphoribosyltransferase-like protein n=1 Tax=Orbus wheelerorum TaxID=3074111 RepID=UPI00370D0C50